MKQGKQPVTKLWLQTHFLSPKKFQASFMTFCPLIHLFFLSSLLTHSIHNYYKCYHFCYFSYMTLFLACSTPVIEINDRITRFSFNQNLIFLINYIIKHDIQMHVFEKESTMKCIHLFSKITNLTFHFQQQLSFTEQNQFWKINIPVISISVYKIVHITTKLWIFWILLFSLLCCWKINEVSCVFHNKISTIKMFGCNDASSFLP